MGVVYVVLIILYLHSREKGDNKTQNINKKTKNGADVSAAGEWNGNHQGICGPERTGANCDRKKALGVNRTDTNRTDFDTGNVVHRDDVWRNADSAGNKENGWNYTDNTDNKENGWSDADNLDDAAAEAMPWAADHSYYGTPPHAAASVYDETDVLCAPPVPLTRLIPTENAERMPITLNKGVCRIGRIPEDNEYCIPSPGISRAHAKISCDEGTVLLQDMHSTNGTYVNNERIRDDDTKELHYGDVVSFAGEEYYCV